MADNPFSQVVDAGEVPAPGRGQRAVVKQPLQRYLALAQAPPRAVSFSRLLEVGHGQGAACGNLFPNRLDVAPLLLDQALQLRPGARRFHTMPKQRIVVHRHERCHVAPTLEEPRFAVGEVVQLLTGIGSEPRERRHVVRTHSHVHRVELQQLYVPEQPVVVPGVDPPRRPLPCESLGS